MKKFFFPLLFTGLMFAADHSFAQTPATPQTAADKKAAKAKAKADKKAAKANATVPATPAAKPVAPAPAPVQPVAPAVTKKVATPKAAPAVVNPPNTSTDKTVGTDSKGRTIYEGKKRWPLLHQ